jgi:hypothetical protein
MGFVKRLAFYLGLLLGLTTISAVGTVALTYLFTGKLISIEAGEGKPSVTLMTADEVATLIHDRVTKADADLAETIETLGGESDD